MQNRILFCNNGTLEDLTEALNNYHDATTSKAWVGNEDALYIGSRFPFAEKYFKVANGTGTLTVQYWNDGAFREVVDSQDNTAGFSQAGYLKFTPDRDYAWTIADTEDMSELSDLTIYDMYWIKVTLSADDTIDLDWIGDLFCTEADLESEFPDLSRSEVKTAFKAGKTDWEEQRVKGTGLVIEDLISRDLIQSSSQIFEVERLKHVTVSKSAEVIYSAFGTSYVDDMSRAHKQYAQRLSKVRPRVDADGDGREDLAESQKSSEVFLYE